VAGLAGTRVAFTLLFWRAEQVIFGQVEFCEMPLCPLRLECHAMYDLELLPESR
jgi:hypothetical protein